MTKERIYKTNSKPWYNKELKKLNRSKQNKYKRFIKNRNRQNESDYLAAKKLYLRKIKSAKRKYHHDRLDRSKNNIKQTWRVINSVLGRSKGENIYKIDIGGKIESDEIEVANEFNSYFSSVAKKLVDKIPPSKSKKKR